MAHYDGPTKKFIEDTSLPEDHSKRNAVARQGVKLLNDVLTSTRQELPKKLVKRTISIASALSASDEGMKKESAVNVIAYLNSRYGDGWHNWEPETLTQTLHADDIEHMNEYRDTLQAYQVVAKTNFPFEEWHVFEKVGHAFNFNPVNFGHLQPLEMDEVALTVKTLKSIRPQLEFEDDIKAYIAASAKEAGMVYLPEDLYPKGCQEFLDKMGNDLLLRDEVAKHYPKESQEETALGIQLARLSEVLEYVKG